MKNNYREITKSLYESTRLANEIEKSIQESKRETKGMIVEGLKGTGGPPSKTGINDFFDGQEKETPEKSKEYDSESGSPGDPGFGDLFEGPGKESDTYKKMKKSLESIDKSVNELGDYIESMRTGFKGSPGRPGGKTFGKLFDGPGQRRPIVDEPGSGVAKGLKDLFKDDEKNYAQKISESLNRSYKHLEKIKENIKAGREAAEEANRLLKTGSDSVPKIPIMPIIPKEISETEKLYKKISEDLEKSKEYIAKIRENAKKGMEALENGRQALKNSGGKVTHGPDCPIIPIPSEKTQEKEKENKKQDKKEK